MTEKRKTSVPKKEELLHDISELRRALIMFTNNRNPTVTTKTGLCWCVVDTKISSGHENQCVRANSILKKTSYIYKKQGEKDGSPIK